MAIKQIDVKPFIYNKTKLTPVDNQAKQIEWYSWYKNDNGWRTYTISQNNTCIEVTRNSLNSLSRICRDWASLIMNEPVTINCENGDELLQQILKDKNFLKLMNEAVEKDYALGGGALIWDKFGDKLQVQFVDATHCFPLSYEDGIVTKCAFSNQQTINGEQYAFISVRDKGFTYNYAIDKNGKELDVAQFNLMPVVINPEITFSFFKPRNLIRDDWNNPFGASVFADAIDANKMVDEAFDSFINEYKLGRKRIFISQDLISYNQTTDSEGNIIVKQVFDPKEAVFNLIPKIGGTEDKTDIKEVNMAIRVNEHEQGIQAALNYLSSLCGLGSRYYKYDNGSITTATQVISENSDLFRNIKKQQLNIDIVIKDFVKGAMALYGIDCGEVSIMHDDSIIIDKNAQMINDQQLVRDRLMSPIEFRMRNFGETKEMAIEMLGMIPEEINNFEDFNLNADTEGNPESTADDNETI